MILFKKANDISNYLRIKSQSGATIGFVPTMGALHQGHLSLLQISKKANSLTVASIFVNPTQFNDKGDFDRYPVTLEKDILALETEGCEILFLPSITEIYPNGTEATRHFQLGRMENLLEGHFRPGHFQGVCQVMHRLLEIIQPHTLVLGQKDYQQCMVIRKLIEQNGWNISLTIAPTLREISGLAMSSRNTLLPISELSNAAEIFQMLQFLKNTIQPGETESLVAKAKARLLQSGFSKVDYVSIADAISLEPVSLWDGRLPVVALVAAFLNGIRLIDNLTLKGKG